MKNFFCMVLALASFSTLAGTEIRCVSANYIVSIVHDSARNVVSANYGINKIMNDGADVEIEKIYLSNRVLAASLKVDGVSNKFELSVAKNAKGQLEGKILTGKSIQIARCTSKYAVTADDRDDDSDVSR